jgi:hypothetical protein
VQGGLRSRSNRRFRESEDVNPLEGAINIVDAMLVFACGLMLALIIHWNVDLEQARERVDLNLGQEVTQDQEVRDNMSETQEQGGLYEKMGTVYKDPVTGRLFMLTEQ